MRDRTIVKHKWIWFLKRATILFSFWLGYKLLGTLSYRYVTIVTIFVSIVTIDTVGYRYVQRCSSKTWKSSLRKWDETSKKQHFGAKMCKKLKLEKRILYFGKRYRLTLITLSKFFMLNSFCLKLFTFNIIKPFSDIWFFLFSINDFYRREMYQVYRIC